MGADADILKPRAKHLLKVLVESYIHSGQPVGSRSLVRESGLDISPATVRSVMAELEEMGFVASPHTSAGRVPTDRGYRYFIDALATFDPPDAVAIDPLRRAVAAGVPLLELASSVSALLSGAASMAAVVMLPRRDRTVLRHVDFVPMDDGRVLALMVVNAHEVRSSMITTERAYSRAELAEAANWLNGVYAGRELADVRRTLAREVAATRRDMDRVAHAALLMAQRVFVDEAPGDDFVVAGQTRLMEFQELSDLEKLRVLFETFNEKRMILQLLDQCLREGGVQVVIGKESGVDVLDDCSLVTATYEADGAAAGVLGVIGPTRMAYRRVIPLVDATAKMVSAALNRFH